MISGRHRTRNEVIDKFSQVPPSSTLSVLATNAIRLQQWPWIEFPSPNPAGLQENTAESLFSLSIEIYNTTWTLIKKKGGWKTNDAEIHTRGTGAIEIYACYLDIDSFGREEMTIEVRIWCWLYVYSSRGRRSQADTTRYERTIRKSETHATVRSRTAVVRNIRDKAYHTVKASIA